jgi:4,5-dihydroxyphthalate decarboxylase
MSRTGAYSAYRRKNWSYIRSSGPPNGGGTSSMSRLTLSIAVGDYDRVRPLVDSSVLVDGVDPVFMLLEPEEIFFRAFRHAEFDICELSMSSFAVKTANGDCPYVGVPVFPSRAFRHNSIYVRTDRDITRPEDLKGKRIGVPEYQVTANVWVRAMLEDDHDVKPSDVTWVRGGYEQPGRVEKIALRLPPDVRVEDAPAGSTISGLLASGEIDAVIGPRAPSCFVNHHLQVRWLYPDPAGAAAAWYRKTSIFPIMHIVGIRRTLADRHPWLPAAVMKAFEQSKARALAKMADVAASKVTLPFIEEQLLAARRLMGEDFWSYGLEANRHVLEVFLTRHHAEGLSSRLLSPNALFHPSTHEAHRV